MLSFARNPRYFRRFNISTTAHGRYADVHAPPLFVVSASLVPKHFDRCHLHDYVRTRGHNKQALGEYYGTETCLSGSTQVASSSVLLSRLNLGHQIKHCWFLIHTFPIADGYSLVFCNPSTHHATPGRIPGTHGAFALPSTAF